MKQYLTLLKIELSNLFNLNKLRDENGVITGKKILTIIGFVAIVLMMLFYVSIYAYMLAESGLYDVLIPLGFVTVSLMTLFTSVYKATATLFKGKDFDLLMSLPISTKTIVLAKLTTLLISELGFALMVMIPIYCIYVNFVGFNVLVFILLFIALIFIPVVPTLVGIFLGFVINLVASRFKSANLMNVVLSFAAIIILYSYIFTTSNEAFVTGLVDMVDFMILQFNQYYPLTSLFSNGVINLAYVDYFLFILISILVAVFTVYIIASQYRALNLLSNRSFAKGNYKMKSLKTNSQFQALYKKEIKKYFSSSTYVLQTSVGCVIAIFFAVAASFFELDMISQFSMIEGGEYLIGIFMPYLLSLFIVMCCITCTSISNEAAQIWLLKSLPIKNITLFNAKIALNLTITVPTVIICGVCLCLGFAFPIDIAVLIFLLPLSFSILAAVFGMLYNVKNPKYDWVSEIQLYKQSMSVFVCLFGGMIVVGASMIGAIALVEYISPLIYGGIVCFVALLASLIIYLQLPKCKIISN